MRLSIRLHWILSRFRTLGGHLQLLTLKQLQKKYPDEEFLPSPENSCQDVPAYRWWSQEDRTLQHHNKSSSGVNSWQRKAPAMELSPSWSKSFNLPSTQLGSTRRLDGDSGTLSRSHRGRSKPCRWRKSRKRVEEILETLQVFCRPSCRAWMEGLDPEAIISPELAHLGGYPDTIVDSFGEPYELCSLAHGMTL